MAVDFRKTNTKLNTTCILRDEMQVVESYIHIDVLDNLDNREEWKCNAKA